LAIFLFDIFGNASIGVYCLTTDKMAIVPPQVTDAKAKKLREWLKVKVIRSTIGGAAVMGALACANSNGKINLRHQSCSYADKKDGLWKPCSDERPWSNR